MSEHLTTPAVIAESRRLLEASKFVLSPHPESYLSVPKETCLVAEDRYSVVGVVVFKSWLALQEGWQATQGALADAISAFYKKGDAKAWEGYLALIGLGPMPPDAYTWAAEIRYDTAHVRKLVALGDDLKTLQDLELLLSPVLKLDLGNLLGSPPMNQGLSALKAAVVSTSNVPESVIDALFAAYDGGTPLVDAMLDAAEKQ